jgi:hypothetical protein
MPMAKTAATHSPAHLSAKMLKGGAAGGAEGTGAGGAGGTAGGEGEDGGAGGTMGGAGGGGGGAWLHATSISAIATSPCASARTYSNSSASALTSTLARSHSSSWTPLRRQTTPSGDSSVPPVATSPLMRSSPIRFGPSAHM